MQKSSAQIDSTDKKNAIVEGKMQNFILKMYKNIQKI